MGFGVICIFWTMIPPYQQRGQPISPSAFNMLIDLARSSLLTAINGGTFQRSISGTNINIAPTRSLTSGGAAESSLPCPFEVTNASEGTTLKVQIRWGLIWQQLPTGMFPDNDPPLKMTVTQTCYVYSKITFNTNTLIPAGVSFTLSTEILENTATDQYNLIARVFVDEEAEPKVISSISNICQQPFPSPCSLAPASS